MKTVVACCKQQSFLKSMLINLMLPINIFITTIHDYAKIQYVNRQYAVPCCISYCVSAVYIAYEPLSSCS